MISMKQWLELVRYRISEGSEFCWKCFGDSAYTLSWWSGNNDEGWSASMVFDTNTQVVYQVSVYDYKNRKEYYFTNPSYKQLYESEEKSRNIVNHEANVITLEVEADWIEKATAIINGIEYDDRIQIELDFSNNEMLKMMTLAHEMDLSLNKFVKHILTLVIENKKDIV